MLPLFAMNNGSMQTFQTEPLFQLPLLTEASSSLDQSHFNVENFLDKIWADDQNTELVYDNLNKWLCCCKKLISNTYSSLNSHLRLCNHCKNQNPEFPYRCPFEGCNKNFKRATAIIYHLVEHDKIYGIHCKTVFSSKELYEEHASKCLMPEQKQKKFKFQEKYQLEKRGFNPAPIAYAQNLNQFHKINAFKDTVLNPWACPCGKAKNPFKGLDNLRRHLGDFHSFQKNNCLEFECPVCNQLFSKLTRVIQHLQLEHCSFISCCKILWDPETYPLHKSNCHGH